MREYALSDGNAPPLDLVSRIISGDRAAEETLVREYTRGVRALLRFQTRTPEVAEDLFQETFLTVIGKTRRGEVRDVEKLNAFIQGVARNIATAHYRKETRDRSDSHFDALERIAAQIPGPLELADHDQAIEILQLAIDSLPVERDKLLLKRYFFEDITVDQLCLELGTNRRHFARVKHRAVRRLIELTKGRLSR